MHEAGTVHRLDRGADRLAVTSDALAQVLQPISVGRRSAALDRLALSVEQVEVETLATEIQTGVQHRNGPPFVYQGRAEHHSAGGPSSWHSLPSGRAACVSSVMRLLYCNGSANGTTRSEQGRMELREVSRGSFLQGVSRHQVAAVRTRTCACGDQRRPRLRRTRWLGRRARRRGRRLLRATPVLL